MFIFVLFFFLMCYFDWKLFQNCIIWVAQLMKIKKNDLTLTAGTASREE